MKKKSVTELGNPKKPHGNAGFEMLKGMNEHHSPVTEWALGFFKVRTKKTTHIKIRGLIESMTKVNNHDL